MNVSEINLIFAKCGLPEVDRARLLEIAGIEGKNFEVRLHQARDGDEDAKAYLGYMIRAVSPAFHDTLKIIGFSTTSRRMIELAKREGKALFRAIFELKQDGPMSREANEYLIGLFTEDAYRPNTTSNRYSGSGTPNRPNRQNKSDNNDLPDFDTFEAGVAKAKAAQTTHSENLPPARSGVSNHTPKARQSSPASQPSAAAAPLKPPFFSFAVYGSRAALCFAEDRTRTGDLPTVRIEAAPIVNRSANWSQKIAIQLTTNEMKLALAVFLEKLSSITLEGHGSGRDKILVIENQEANFFVRVGQKGRGYAVPVRAQEATGIVSLLFKQIIAGEPHLDMKTLDTILTNMANKILATDRTAQAS